MQFSRRFMLMVAAWWIIWPVFHYFLLRWYGIEPSLAVVDTLVSNALLAACCLGMTFMLRYYRPGEKNAFYLFIWVILLAKGWSFGVQKLLPHLLEADASYLEMLVLSWPVRMAIGMLMIGVFLLGGWVQYFLRQKQDEENRKLELENLSRQAELLTLRQQLQPHFLFNTLNSISALAGSRPEEARHMIHQLSDFLRGTLHKEDNTLLTLDEELKHLQLYLDIEKVRFGHRLQTEIVAGTDCLQKKLPALLLQPLVENAIKFGLYDTLEAVTIQITASCDPRNLVLRITNPFDPETVRSQKGTGFGLSSVKRRLFLLFGRADLLQTETAADQYTVTLKIPQ